MNDNRDFIDVVKQRTDIVAVIGERIQLDRHHKALCPFHAETIPSFSVNPKEQYFNCFGCGRGGDVIAFLMMIDNRAFPDVLQELAERAGVCLPEEGSNQRKALEKARSIEDVLSATAQYYHGQLSDEARLYLTEKRGLTDEAIQRFQIGYADGGLRKHLEEQGFDLDLGVEAGVLRRDDDSKVRDYFYRRIIFPNLRQGRVVHLIGRSIDDSEPKYLLLPRPIDHLYNEDSLRSAEVVMAEGVFDCLSAEQAGYPTVASLGTNCFKAEFAEKLAQCSAVYLCFDGDEAGRAATLKVGQVLPDRARVVELPDDQDLNDYFRNHSREEFEQLRSRAMSVIEYQVKAIPRDVRKIDLRKHLDPILHQLAHLEPVDAEAYLSSIIKDRFYLTREDLTEYRSIIKRIRKEEMREREQHSVDFNENREYTAEFQGLVDIVLHESASAFLIIDGTDLQVHTEIEDDGIVYIPPPKEKIPWLLPRADKVKKVVHESDEALWDALTVYHKQISELPTEQHYTLLTAWDFHTHLLEAFQQSPILTLFAVPERGKSRTGKGAIYVARRGVHVESLREAYIFRLADRYTASIFFDVMDIWAKARRYNSEDLLLHRFERGARVPRVNRPDLGHFRDTTFFSVFGPTIIGTNVGVDSILETRSVMTNMPATDKAFEINVTPELALPLKERLTAFRARHMGEDLPNIPKPARGRLGDIMKPLLQIINLVKPSQAGAFKQFVLDIETQRRVEKSVSLEARILTAVIGSKWRTIKSVSVNAEILPVKLITDMFNNRKGHEDKITYQMAGRRLSAMGFRKVRHEHKSAIVWDQKLIRRLTKTYGLEEPVVDFGNDPESAF